MCDRADHDFEMEPSLNIFLKQARWAIIRGLPETQACLPRSIEQLRSSADSLATCTISTTCCWTTLHLYSCYPTMSTLHLYSCYPNMSTLHLYSCYPTMSTILAIHHVNIAPVFLLSQHVNIAPVFLLSHHVNIAPVFLLSHRVNYSCYPTMSTMHLYSCYPTMSTLHLYSCYPPCQLQLCDADAAKPGADLAYHAPSIANALLMRGKRTGNQNNTPIPQGEHELQPALGIKTTPPSHKVSMYCSQPSICCLCTRSHSTLLIACAFVA